MCKECDGVRSLSRRDFLRYAAIGMGVTALGPLGTLIPSAEASPPPLAPVGQNMFVILNLYGGNDGLNTVVPVALSNYAAQRQQLALNPASLLSLDMGPAPNTSYMLHPALPNIGQLWSEGSVAIVQKVGYPTANLSHFLSQDIWSYGVRGNFSGLPIDRSGWIARFADLYTSSATGAVAVYGGRPLDFVGGARTPFQVASLNRFQFLNDPLYRDNHLHRLETIQNTLAAVSRTGLQGQVAAALDQAHALSTQVQQAVANFTDPGTYDPGSNIGRYLKDIAILIEGGFDTQIFFTGFGGFDHHSNQLAGQATLLARLDDAVGAFADNLKALGVWDQTVIGLISEFGRRNYANGSDGTDHGTSNALMFIGGAVNGGMYGPDITEADLDPGTPPGFTDRKRYLDYEVDFRSLYKEVLSAHLQVDPAPIFPEAQEKDGILGIV